MIKINSADICLADSVTTYTILKSKIYFTHLIIEETSMNFIIDSTKMSEGFRRAIFFVS